MTHRLGSGRLLTAANFPLLVALALVAVACNSKKSSSAPIGIAPEPVVTSADSLPGVVVTIENVSGGSGPNGSVRSGDKLKVDYKLATTAGEPLELSTFSRGAIMVSGPTFNYQRVIASQSDLRDVSTKRAVGSYTYRFTVPMPAAYIAPLNDTPSFTDGELTDQALLSGTYTVGIEARKDYKIGGTTYRDPGNDHRDFLFGDAPSLMSREVVTLANCNQCHGELKAHGENRDKITNCLLCHTAGSEDGNDPAAGGGTPGVSVDFKVMIHKIHAGAKLPSVNGVTTNADGSRNYGATPKPYVVQGYRSSLHDFSDVVFPVWPSTAAGMPRDAGYSALSSAQKSQENTMLGGPVECSKCHGDPDGSGPAPAPVQGDLAYSQPSRQACGSCHDDWVFDHLYTANGSTMPVQRDDAACKNCHRVSGTALDVIDAHNHPLADTATAPGILFDLLSVTDVGNGNGRFEAGEKMRVTMTIKDKNGTDVPAASLARIEAILNGPATNPNLVHYVRIASAGIGAGPAYAFDLPQTYYYEPIGTSTGTGSESFATARAPHWNVSGAETSLMLRTGTAASSALRANAQPLQNYIDVTIGTGSNFNRNDYIVIEDGSVGLREYLKIQNVEGDRLWFSSAYSPNYAPSLRNAHVLGTTVDVITTADIPTTSYVLDALTGVVMETTEFGSGEVIATYTSDFVVPANYPGAFNESPDLDQSWGDWIGLPIRSGTYAFGISGARSFNVTVASENTSYREASDPNVVHLPFGTATVVAPIARIESDAGCKGCHEDIQFHGSFRRGYDNCLLCHGTAGSEDAPTYVYSAGAATPGVTIDFRTMLHKIHHGKELAAGANYVVAGFGGNGHSYEHVGFPNLPGGTLGCAVCHGENNTAWVAPNERAHPMAGKATRTWRAACGSCHDSTAAAAHIDVNTSLFGAEACAICHGVGEEQNVVDVHKKR